MDRARQDVKLGEIFAKELPVTACVYIKDGAILDKCPFYESNIRHSGFCGWYIRGVREPERRAEFCELTLVRIEGIRRG